MVSTVDCAVLPNLTRVDREAAHARYAHRGLRPTAAGHRAYR